MNRGFAILGVVVLLAGGGGIYWWQKKPATHPELTADQRYEFERHMKQGLELLRSLQVGRALAEFDQCLEIDPWSSDAHFQKARAWMAQGEKAKAEEELETVDGIDSTHVLTACLRDRIHPDATDIHTRLKQIYGGLYELNQAFLRELLKGDVRSLTAAWSLPPQFVPANDALTAEFMNAVQAFSLHVNVESNSKWEAFLANVPGLTGIRLFYASILHRGRTRFPDSPRKDLPPAYSGYTIDLARRHYEAVLDQAPPGSPEHCVALYGIGDLNLRMGDYPVSQEYLKLFLQQEFMQELKLEQWTRAATFLLGTAYYKHGNYDLATSMLRPLYEQRDIQSLWLLHLMQKEKFPFRPDPVKAAPMKDLEFREEAGLLGIAKVTGAGPSAWGDVDGDGDLDLFVTGCDTYSTLYRNDGERFTDVSQEAGLLKVPAGFSSTLIDFDNNGTLDLYIGRNGWVGPAPNSLFKNRGDGTFEDVTEHAGVQCPNSTFVHSWGDFDRDGFLDLFTANGVSNPANNRLYHNNGDGTFSDWTERCGVLEPVGTRTIGFAIGDYDKDGWLDLFLSGFEKHNRLYHNRGDGTFEEVSSRAGLRVEGDVQIGYVAFFEDVNNDAWPDLIATKQAPFQNTLLGYVPEFVADAKNTTYSCRLFLNRHDGTFEDVTLRSGFAPPHGAMGANTGDVNNDGLVDVYFGTGGPDIYWLEMNTFLLNRGGGTFIDLTRSLGLAPMGKGHGVTFADFDEDGDQDLFSSQGGFEMGDLWPCVFYRNLKGNQNHWLQVALVGTKSNRMGVGAQLTLRAGELLVYREMKGGTGFGSCNSPIMQFGLHQRAAIDLLEIRWPSGQIDQLTDLPVDCCVVVKEGAGWEPRRPTR